MRIVRIDIENFRAVKKATLFPEKHNVYLGPNNIGKTTVLEALNFLLNPEISPRPGVVNENDFYRRLYRAPATQDAGQEAEPSATAIGEEAPQATAGEAEATAAPAPFIRVEAVLTGLTDEDVSEHFGSVLVPWKNNAVVESTNLGDDPFEDAERAIRPCFEAWYDEEEDDFIFKSFFRTDPALPRDDCPSVTRAQKRAIGFLIYRDFRALQRPVTLEPTGLFSRLLQSQDATPKSFENVLDRLTGAGGPLFADENFARVVNEYREELGRYLPLASPGTNAGRFSFEMTNLTREEVKAISQLYIEDALSMPIQRMGAGTRSLAILAVLLQIARKRGRGILALEEPETFLFPHAQRRIVDEVLSLASQTFVTTHSPYVLERMPLASYQRIKRDGEGRLETEAVVRDAKSGRQMRDRHRQQLAEALLGRGAIVVEEESVRQWILKASAQLHGAEYDGAKRSALELHGIAVLSAEGNGEVAKLARLLHRAGVNSIGFLDQVDAKDLASFTAENVALVFHSEWNLEDLLSKELPRSVLESILSTASSYKKNVYQAADLGAMSDDDLRKKAKVYLQNHKGYLPFHEEILETLSLDQTPATFKRLVCLVERLGEVAIEGTQTI